MRYRILGQSGIRISEIGLGAMGFRRSDDTAESRRILAAYSEADGNFIDTADSYGGGESEAAIGEILGARRHQFVLSTKYTNQTDPEDPNSAGNSRKNLARSIEGSLRRLRTEYVDLYWVHLRDSLTPVEEVMRSLDDVVRSGKALAIGASDWSAWEVAQANAFARSHGMTPFSAVQLRYNLLDRTAEADLLPMVEAFGLCAVGWGPLADGRLSGKYLDGYDARGLGRLSENGWFEFSRAGGDEVVRQVVEIAHECGASAAQVALAWLLHDGRRVVPLFAARTAEQLRSNLSAQELTLDSEQLARLDAVSAPTLPFPHNVTREHSIAMGAHGRQLEQIDDPRARAVLRRTRFHSAVEPDWR